MAWCAAVLGKCGGREMGFASDIEMLFLYEEDGATHGRRPLDATAFNGSWRSSRIRFVPDGKAFFISICACDPMVVRANWR